MPFWTTPWPLALWRCHSYWAWANLAYWLSVATGVAALILTILTDHHLGLIRILPYGFHLLVDGLVGVAFVAAPFVLGFSGIDLGYYLALGITVLIVVSLHKPESSAVPAQ